MEKKNIQKICTIEEFVSKLIENMEDLDPEFSRLIDEHFWELVDKN